MPKIVPRTRITERHIRNCLAGAKIIVLTKGQVTYVDEEDFDRLNQWKWYARATKKNFYVCRKDKFNRYKSIDITREILGNIPKGKEIDHANRNTLDNRKSNLRICNRSQNNMNRPKFVGSSKYKGVCWHRRAKKWRATINKNNKQIYLGLFENEKVAAEIYDEIAIKMYGDFAYLNFGG